MCANGQTWPQFMENLAPCHGLSNGCHSTGSSTDSHDLIFSCAKEPQRDFGLDPGSWNETFLFESYFQRRDPFHRVFNKFS